MSPHQANNQVERQTARDTQLKQKWETVETVVKIEGIVGDEWIKDHTQRNQKKKTSITIEIIRHHQLEDAIYEREQHIIQNNND